MPTSQPINNTRLSGSDTFTLTKTNFPGNVAVVTIDRTINGGLNSLTTADTLTISVDRSFDDGATWNPVAGITCVGGTIVTKGVVRATESLAVGIDDAGTGFRINTVTSTPVRIAGTVDYSNG